MDRRRALSSRPATSEEIQYWAHAASALNTFRDKYNSPTTVDAIGRVNRSISAWPVTSSDDGQPMESLDTVMTTYKKLTAGLTEIKEAAETEAKAAEQAIEALSVLIALRRAPEGPQNTDKRAKRHRGSSPLSTPGTPIPALNGKVAFNARPDRDRASEGPNGIPYQSYKMEPKARKKFYDKQFPLQEGRKVAFHPPKTPTTADENAWILAIITRCLNQEKNRYEVQDAEPQEDGQSGQVYSGTIKNMVPLPDIEAPFNHMSHPNQYPVFATGSTVLALYPDTSCFYRAEVIEVLPGGRDTQTGKAYRLRFEDDDDQVHTVQGHWVVEWLES